MLLIMSMNLLRTLMNNFNNNLKTINPNSRLHLSQQLSKSNNNKVLSSPRLSKPKTNNSKRSNKLLPNNNPSNLKIVAV